MLAGEGWLGSTNSYTPYPNIAAVAHVLPALDDPENFALALGLMIEAIRARAAAVARR